MARAAVVAAAAAGGKRASRPHGTSLAALSSRIGYLSYCVDSLVYLRLC